MYIVQRERSQLLKIATKLKLQNTKDWYKVGVKEIRKAGGGSLLTKYGDAYTALTILLPENEWNILNFSRLPHNFFKKEGKIREYADAIYKELGFTTMNDWYSVDAKTLLRFAGGSSLLRTHRWDMMRILNAAYPKHVWSILQKKKKPAGYMSCSEHRRDVACHVFNTLKLTSMEDMYQITTSAFRKGGGGSLLKLHSSSLVRTIQSCFPNYPWEVWRYRYLPQSHWSDMKNIKALRSRLIRTFRIRRLEDWYRISSLQLDECHAEGLRYYGGLHYVLSTLYPDVQWKKPEFSVRSKRSVQRELYLAVDELCEGKKHLYENHKHSDLPFALTGCFGELDIFLPEMNIAFEYNGEHHYEDNPVFGPLDLYRGRDLEKLSLCKSNEIDLVIVPYWWDKTSISLNNYLASLFPMYFSMQSALLPGSSDITFPSISLFAPKHVNDKRSTSRNNRKKYNMIQKNNN